MDLQNLQRNWESFAATDPLWAILTWPEKKGGRWTKEEFFATGRAEIAAVLAFAESLPVKLVFGRALDFGCGVGRLTQALAARFNQVHGVDIAPAMIALAKTYNYHSTKCFYHLNAEVDLKLFPDNHFDFIYSRLTLQHMEPKFAKAYIQEFVRTLRLGGLLIFQMPARLSPNAQSGHMAPAGNLKNRLKRQLPARLLNAYRKLRGLVGQKPVMEIYGIEKSEIKNLLLQSGAKLLSVDEFGDAGPEWISLRYSASK